MYSRQSPSKRYQELIEQNRRLHLQGAPAQGLPPELSFPGKSIFRQLPHIKRLVEATASVSLLDYGCGKGQQYEAQSINVNGAQLDATVQDFLDVDYIYCYDAAYPMYTKLPSGKFDGVISTDVLEHCPEDDLPWIIDEMFSYANRFVFASVAGFPAAKTLPNGENAHCTQLDPKWWNDTFTEAAARHANVTWEVWHSSLIELNGQRRFDDVRLGNSGR